MQTSDKQQTLEKCYEAITGCRACGSTIFQNVIDLGMQALPDFGRSTPDWTYAPLELVQCLQCQLVQLRHTVTRDRVFRTYFYRSGGSETMRASLLELADAARQAVELNEHDTIVDIGANDGTLLKYFYPELRQIAFEPALNVPFEVPTATLVRDYFSATRFLSVSNDLAKLVISAAMFYSVPNPSEFADDVRHILAPDGVWIIEMNDLQTLVENTGFDIIGHEHLTIWSLNALTRLLNQHTLEPWRVERVPTNGGSIRVYVCHQGQRSVEPSVGQQLVQEQPLDLIVFKRRVEELCEALVLEISHARRNSNKVYLYAASTRACTVIQTARIDVSMVAGAVERDMRKVGYLVPGTRIPIISEVEMREAKPDYLLTLSPYFINQFLAREREFIARGGQFIVVFPTVHRVGAG